MTCYLPADCLNEIFEYLEQNSLYLCLLVNRLWCRVAVRILWRNALSFRKDIRPQLLNTLISCLPNDSKELLYTNGIFIPTPTSNPPLFNYISYIKVLPIYETNRLIESALKSQQV